MRLIDADAFKDYIRNALEETKHIYKDNGAWAKEITESLCKDIDEQPTIQPEPHWIPVTERLPKKSVEVLTCDSVGTIEVRSLEVSYDGMLYWENQEGECERLSDAIAWMPLPEPYKGSDK